MLEEDQSADSEMEVDWWQQVSYFVIDGFSDLTGDVYTPPQSNAGSMKLARPALEEATPTPTATPRYKTKSCLGPSRNRNLYPSLLASATLFEIFVRVFRDGIFRF